MKDKILNWINENCFTDKALIAVNVWEVMFYLYCIRLYFSNIQHLNSIIHFFYQKMELLDLGSKNW